MSNQITIRKAAAPNPADRRKALHLVKFEDDFRGDHYAIFHGVGTRGRYFEGRTAYARATMAFVDRRAKLGYIDIANAAGPVPAPTAALC